MNSRAQLYRYCRWATQRLYGTCPALYTARTAYVSSQPHMHAVGCGCDTVAAAPRRVECGGLRDRRCGVRLLGSAAVAACRRYEAHRGPSPATAVRRGSNRIQPRRCNGNGKGADEVCSRRCGWTWTLVGPCARGASVEAISISDIFIWGPRLLTAGRCGPPGLTRGVASCRLTFAVFGATVTKRTR